MASIGRCYLFIDVQNFFFDWPADRSGELPDPDTYLPRWEQLLASARQAAARSEPSTAGPVKVAHVQHTEGAGEPGERGTKAWELRFSPQGDEPVYEKTVASVFESNPDLADQLRAQGVHELVIAGCESAMCVEAACRGAVAEKFDVVLLSGAHTTLAPSKEAAEALSAKIDADLAALGVRVVPWDQYQW